LSAKVAQIAEEKQTIVNLVSTGVGLAIVPKWTARLAVGGVSFVPLDLPQGSARNKLALSAVWLRDTRVLARDAFLAELDKHINELEKSA
jgi:DNA-binding transcriptional LysR family regulator